MRDGYHDGVLNGSEKRMVWRLMAMGMVHSAPLKQEMGYSYQITEAGRRVLARNA